MSDLTIYKLIAAYKNHPLSSYCKKDGLRYHTRKNYDSLLHNLADQPIIENWLRVGDVKLADLKGISFIGLHAFWAELRGQIPMAHAIMTIARILINFGVVLLEDDECTRLAIKLRAMKFKNGKRREHILTAQQVIAIRCEAHKRGRPSIALEQTIQFAATLRQKDVIGEWVPLSEPGISDVHSLGAGKWLRGVRWETIDANLVLRHVTSKKEKPVVVDLTLDPMVMEELRSAYGASFTRAMLPASGPVIIDETTGLPWIAHQFRKEWRDIARAVGVSDKVQNRDSRAGAITEALGFGAAKDDVRKAATHSEEKQTSDYSRDEAAAIARVMRLRAAGRAREQVA